MADILGSEFLTAPGLITNVPVTTATTNAVSTTAVDVLGDVQGGGYFDFAVTGAAVFIVFGVAGMTAATTANGFPLAPGTVKTWWITPDKRYYRAIATSVVAGQSITHVRSGP